MNKVWSSKMRLWHKNVNNSSVEICRRWQGENYYLIGVIYKSNDLTGSMEKKILIIIRESSLNKNIENKKGIVEGHLKNTKKSITNESVQITSIEILTQLSKEDSESHDDEFNTLNGYSDSSYRDHERNMKRSKAYNLE